MMYASMNEAMAGSYAGGHWPMAFHGLFSLTLTVLLIIAALWLFRRQWRGGAACGHGDGAIDILGARYAQGEIDQDEFLEKRDVLASRRRRRKA